METHLAALQAGRSGLIVTPFEDCRLPTHTGPVAGLAMPLVGEWADWDCRCNRLSALALAQDGFTATVADWAARLGPGRLAVLSVPARRACARPNAPTPR